MIDSAPARLGYWAGRVFDGILGVRCFFTISGFLITWLMIQEERKRGSVSLKNFYARRALRILPVYFAGLAALALAQMSGWFDQSAKVWLQLLTFTRNFHQTGHLDPAASAHFWSLAVEEQFYLVWPPVFLWLARSTGKRIGFLSAIIQLSFACKVVALLGSYDRHLFFLFQEQSTFIVMDCVALGCLGAVLMDARPRVLEKILARPPAPIFAVGALLVLLPAIAGLDFGMQSVGLIVLLLQSILAPAFLPFRLLNHPAAVKVGVWSYSIYIWQQLIFVFWPLPRVWFLALPAAFVIGWLSYRFWEKPFLALREKFRASDSR